MYLHRFTCYVVVIILLMSFSDTYDDDSSCQQILGVSWWEILQVWYRIKISRLLLLVGCVKSPCFWYRDRASRSLFASSMYTYRAIELLSYIYLFMLLLPLCFLFCLVLLFPSFCVCVCVWSGHGGGKRRDWLEACPRRCPSAAYDVPHAVRGE